ncbi:type II secretion system protein N [Allosphingosinicella vermicomposti]|uniref:type II secretion system protein N n=1 Tax=Allosphingosinicella vermicomposti TaxID=614671 RepID=UPI000D0F8B50|nr:type II secretion system protein N [Allosphingosinicella vermicomposti]
MRFRLPLGRSLFFGCATIAALAAFLPLRIVVSWLDLDEQGLAAREVEGSLWSGTIREAQFTGLPLGDLDARLQILPLLTLRARMDVESPANPEQVKGGISVTRTSSGIDDMNARIDTAALFAPLPLMALTLSDVSVRFTNGACDKAGGRVSATLAAMPGLPALPSPSGDVRCDGGALLLPLAAGSSERVDIRLHADGRYEARLQTAGGGPEMAPVLTAAGFTAGAGGYVLERRGKF